MVQAAKTKIERVFDTLINSRSLDGREVFLFGHCNATEEMVDALLDRGVTPAAILDNSVCKQRLAFRDVPIVPPDEILKYSAENSIVLIASRHFADMAAQLRGFGYDGEIIQVARYNSFAEYSLSDETIERKKARIQRGAVALTRIRAINLAQHLVVCPNNALGDVYWALAFLPEYCKKQGISDVAVIVSGNGCLQVAEMFGIEKTVTLSETEMDEFVQAVIFTREENCIIAHHDRPYTDNIIKYLDKRFLSFIDYYRCAVYGLSKDIQPSAPNCLAAFENKTGIPKGKSVILSPYAKSVVELPDRYWETLAAQYAEQGYAVYTNTIDGEAPIGGTQSLSIPISQMISAAEYAGTFIGLRNGLCDVLYTASCHKTVIFPDCYYSTTPHKVSDFFDLPGWEKILSVWRSGD